MSSQDERRQTPRYPANIRIRFRRESEEAWLEGQMMTVGIGGVFIRTDEELPLGEPVLAELPLHDEVCITHSIVAWVCKEPPVGFGIRFSSSDRELQARILEEIDSGLWLVEGASKKDKAGSHIFLSDISAFVENASDDSDTEASS